jgi:peptide deformylase
MKLQIRTLPDPILRQKAKPVSKIDPRIKTLAQEMAKFLKNDEPQKVRGVGLSAPQIGQSLRIIVVWSKASHRVLTMINPVIVWYSKRTCLGISGGGNPYEGCLSVPGVWGKVRRHSVVKVRYLTPAGNQVVRKFRQLTGVVAQHEIDHLDGILFIDRIIQQKGEILKQTNESQ